MIFFPYFIQWLVVELVELFSSQLEEAKGKRQEARVYN
jgi:hypothetical protein